MSLLTDFQSFANVMKSALGKKADKSELTPAGDITSSTSTGYAVAKDVYSGLSGKQNTLTAGTGISISNDTISATGGLPSGTNNGDILVWNGTAWVAKKPSRLPNGFIEVEYIESSGTQYIDTGFKPTSDFRIVMELEMPAVTAQSDYAIFGCYASSNYTCYTMGGYNGQYHAEYGTTTAHFFTQTSFSGKTTITYDNGNITITDGTTTDTADLSAQSHSSSSASMLIFANKNMSLPSPYIQGLSSFKLYSFKIWSGGVYEQFVPCVRDSDGEAGLYGLARERFYTNQGTGDFIVPST